jgi:chromosome segregation protein
MKVALTRLRIAGFKSFAEPAALDILPGLTGIVGPNGCGKSNVVEALRWAMGETSARSLRGGDMDDVIFAGTVARPSRNLAEVTITLAGELPEPYAAESELAVTRRIERGAGSGFRANGRELRARDVQTLYADLASGARSSGMVSQGRVAALVGAKPEDRRQVLEEAAGITGLHARRHEAELKLRATEQNLARAEDLRTQLDASRENLRKQAKAAARYRNISGLIRAAEAEHLAILLGQAEAARAAAETAYAQAADAAADAVRAVEQAGAALVEAEASVPAPRAQESACRSMLERRRMEAENLAAELQRATDALAEAEARVSESQADLDEVLRNRDEAAAFTARLAAESDALDARAKALPALLAEARQQASDAAEADRAASETADTAADAAAQAAAAHRQAEQTCAAAAAFQAAARARAAKCREEHDALASVLVAPETLAEAQRVATEAAEAAEAARRHLDEAETLLMRANAALADRKGAWERAAAAHDAAAARTAEARRRADLAAGAVIQLERDAAAAAAARVPAERVQAAAEAAEAATQAAVAAEAALAQAEQAVRAADAERQAAASAAASAAADYERARSLAEDAARRAENLGGEVREHRDRIAEAQAALPDPDILDQAEAKAASAAEALASCRTQLQALAAARSAAEDTLASARAAAAESAAEILRHSAEIDGLQAALAEAAPQPYGRAIDALTVPPGLEAAVAAALGEAADHALDPDAPRHWRTLPPLPAPSPAEDSVCLASLIEAPAELTRLLTHAVLISGDGATIQAQLQPGQVAVNAEGACWRWDGLVTGTGVQTAATRLRQRNRLQSVLALSAEAETRAEVARQRVTEAGLALQAAQASETAAKTQEAALAAQARTAADASAAAAASAAEARARHEALLPALSRILEAQAAADRAAQEARQNFQTLADPSAQQAADAASAARLAEARSAQTAAQDVLRQTRAQAMRAQDEARRIAAEAAAADQRASLLEAPLARARDEQQRAAAALHEAETSLASLENPAHLLAEAEQAAATAEQTSAHAEAARQARSAAGQAATQARAQADDLAIQYERTKNALSAQATLLAQATQDEAAADVALAEAQAAQAALPDAAALAEASVQSRRALAAARHQSLHAASTLQSLTAEAGQVAARQTSLAAEVSGWRARLAEAERSVTQRQARAEAAQRQCLALAAAPEEIGRRAQTSGASLAEAERTQAEAAAALAAAEDQLRAAHAASRQADSAEAASRAALARAEGTRDATHGALAAVHARIAERLADSGTPLPSATDISDTAEERARRRAERLAREREEMGPVNLRADIELAEIDERAATLERERDELNTAIAKLRGAIGHLNREGRARLSAVFTEVDRHFSALFTRAMGGGRAHLSLTGSDDPLLAGLEIYAEPPGKKLSTLSLLSGGEQALTALSLIFAVFRCTPAPVSVLDEVDAPLDDANVDRFCNLLDEMVRDTGTRFLVVTHHQLTMSRMDRLYGVTMQERGVSRLLSVDLQRATALVAEETLQAAE